MTRPNSVATTSWTTSKVEPAVTGLSREDHELAGALFGSVRGVDVVRHYGDPGAEYAAAVEGVALRDRSHRALLSLTGRAPVTTLSGVLTGRMPRAPVESAEECSKGRAEYSAVLTPKGRVIADLRAMWGWDSAEESVWLDVPAPALGALLEHLKRYLPPRLAAVEDVSSEWSFITVMGPDAASALGTVIFGSDSVGVVLESMVEGDYLVSDLGERVIRSGEVDTPAWDLLTPGDRTGDVWRKLVDGGGRPVGVGVWDTLRVEAGRPCFGQDMDDSNLLPEVGLVDRAVDHAKGCYTGQEVIVRIRDRGHVNRTLRGLRLGDGPSPANDAELFHEGDVVGQVTTAVQSPRAGGGIALAYVRREVPAGGTVNVSAADGPEATVHELEPGWARS